MSDRRTAIEKQWHELRGGVFTHELSIHCPGDGCPPGHLSINALIGRTLGGPQLPASVNAMSTMSARSRCGPEASTSSASVPLSAHLRSQAPDPRVGTTRAHAAPSR